MLIFIIFAAIVLLIGLILFLYLKFNNYFKSLQNAQKNDQTLSLMQKLMDNTSSQVKEATKSIDDTRKEIFNALNRNTDTLRDQLSESNKNLNKRLTDAARVIGDLSRELGGVKEIGRTMRDFQDFLKSPKLRGNIGEQVLKDLLEQILPRQNFDLQYQFKEGQTVDAIIKTGKGLIPIDAKFPLENFHKMSKAEIEKDILSLRKEFVRDVKKHINAISQKYILPQEGTVDFALMYVPSEVIWYEVVRDDQDLNDYSQSKKVLLVSPNSFYYFLQIILMGLREQRIADASKRILGLLSEIKRDNYKFSEVLGVMSKHITNAKNSCDNVLKDHDKLTNKIDSIEMLDLPKKKDIDNVIKTKTLFSNIKE